MSIEQLRIREKSDEREECLSPFAVRSRLSKGRKRPEEPCPIRTAFQRDRDRILYSNSFRRLKHKTQVFIAPQGDHFVTRLTHTLEVSQIARTIARALNLNEDLTEAISLGHDLGHTPFGHTGEAVLNEIYPPGFRHNEQSLRVVDVLENDGMGLNLTWEVRDGIVNHSKTSEKVLKDWGYRPDGSEQVSTLEGSIAKISDAIAYVNHDIDDAIRAGVIKEKDLPAPSTNLLGHSHSERINSLVSDIIVQSWPVAGTDPRVLSPSNSSASEAIGIPAIVMSPAILDSLNILRDFLFEKVYNREASNKETAKARETLRKLYAYFNRHEDRLPPEYRLPHHPEDDTSRRVVDYIAGMTDQFATRLGKALK